MIRAKQHALVAHLKGPSNYDDVMAEIENGHVKSRSAVFMLRLIDTALAEEWADRTWPPVEDEAA
jgi:hypothetical protein